MDSCSTPLEPYCIPVAPYGTPIASSTPSGTATAHYSIPIAPHRSLRGANRTLWISMNPLYGIPIAPHGPLLRISWALIALLQHLWIPEHPQTPYDTTLVHHRPLWQPNRSLQYPSSTLWK